MKSLRAATQAVAMLQPDGEAPGMPSTETTEPLFQTLGLFARAPSLIDCDVQHLRQAMTGIIQQPPLAYFYFKRPIEK